MTRPAKEPGHIAALALTFCATAYFLMHLIWAAAR